MSDVLSLVADIGGTNTRLALAKNGAVDAKTIQRFKNADAGSFEQIVGGYFTYMQDPACCACCIAVAGPVRGVQAQMTNLDWIIDATGIGHSFNIPEVSLLNDLEALGHGLSTLGRKDQNHILGPEPAKGDQATKLVIGVGTGVNIAVVHAFAGGTTRITPAEYGHASLPIHSAQMLKLVSTLPLDGAYCSIEDALSGRGFENLYRCVGAKNGRPAALSHAEIWAGLDDLQDPDLAETAQYFVQFLASVTVDLSLCHLPFGGIYLAGGVARKLAPYFDRFGFGAAFQAQDKKTDLMQAMGVTLIQDDYAALKGCANFLAQKQV